MGYTNWEAGRIPRIRGTTWRLRLFALVFRRRTQAISAALSGRILDTSGGSVSKARVTITSAATGFVSTAQSSDTGEYTIPALPGGEYTVSVEFAQWIQ
jgi:hypothetical protein